MIRNVDNPRTEVSEGKLVMEVAESTAQEVVGDFKYLDAYIANCHVDFNRCMQRTCMEPVLEVVTDWKSKEISLSLTLRLFDSLILSIIFCNAETWTITKVMKKEIDSFGTSCYRYLLGIRRIDKVRNKGVL